MHKINLKKPLLQLNGLPVSDGQKEVMLSESIANCISQSGSQSNSLKLFEMAEKLYKTGELNVDTTDLTLFKDQVESNQMAAINLKGQVLKEIAKQVK